jgi:hypothetical protein
MRHCRSTAGRTAADWGDSKVPRPPPRGKWSGSVGFSEFVSLFSAGTSTLPGNLIPGLDNS